MMRLNTQETQQLQQPQLPQLSPNINKTLNHTYSNHMHSRPFGSQFNPRQQQRMSIFNPQSFPTQQNPLSQAEQLAFQSAISKYKQTHETHSRFY